MSLSDVMDSAFRVLRARFKSIAIILGVVVVPVDFLSALVTRRVFDGFNFTSVFNSANGVQTTTTFGPSSNVVSVLSALVSWIVLPFAAGAISALVACAYLGAEITPRAALAAAGRRWWALLLATVVVHVLEGIGLLLVILPGLLMMALCVAVAPAIVVERLGPIQGIRRAWQLDRRRLWGVLGIALVTGLVFRLAGAVVSVPLQLIGVALGLRWGWLLIFVASVWSSVFSVALSAIVATLVYFDGRIRTEGFDLEVLAGRLGG